MVSKTTDLSLNAPDADVLQRTWSSFYISKNLLITPPGVVLERSYCIARSTSTTTLAFSPCRKCKLLLAQTCLAMFI